MGNERAAEREACQGTNVTSIEHKNNKVGIHGKSVFHNCYYQKKIPLNYMLED